MFARMSLSQAARLCSQQTRGFASSAARSASHAAHSHSRPRAHGHPLFSNVSPQFFTANKFQPGCANSMWEAQQNALRARYQLRGFHADRKQSQHPAFTASFFNRFGTTASARAAATSGKSATTSATTTSTRGFCGGRSRFDPSVHKNVEHWHRWHKHHMRWYHHHHRRRPFRFLFKAVVFSTALIAIPAIVIFGASTAIPLLFVPVAVGGALFFAGGLVFFVLPVVLIGGAVTFFAFGMPAAVAFKDINKILKRDKKCEGYSSALGSLGKDWEIQPAGKDEYFHWSFPTKHQPLDKVELRFAVFDPEDNSRGKQKTLKWIDRIVKEINIDSCDSRDDDDDDDDDNEDEPMSKKKWSKKHSGRFEYHSSKLDREGPKDMTLRRDGNHIEVMFEDDGEKIMKSKVGKKYLKLGKIVDRAASEIETREGRNLGDQVVLVRKVNHGSFWWTPYGDIALRIPFSRQWVHDLSDE